jgi:hypothetical protein
MVRKLPEGSFRLANYVNNEWSIVPDDGTAFDDVLVPVYWTNVARKLKPGDLIKVHAPDGSYYAELYVRSAERLAASVVVLNKMDFGSADAAEVGGDDLTVKWRNHKALWGVVRGSDKAVVKDNFPTRETAEEWLRDRRRGMAA